MGFFCYKILLFIDTVKHEFVENAFVLHTDGSLKVKCNKM